MRNAVVEWLAFDAVTQYMRHEQAVAGNGMALFGNAEGLLISHAGKGFADAVTVVTVAFAVCLCRE